MAAPTSINRSSAARKPPAPKSATWSAVSSATPMRPWSSTSCRMKKSTPPTCSVSARCSTAAPPPTIEPGATENDRSPARRTGAAIRGASSHQPLAEYDRGGNDSSPPRIDRSPGHRSLKLRHSFRDLALHISGGSRASIFQRIECSASRFHIVEPPNHSFRFLGFAYFRGLGGNSCHVAFPLSHWFVARAPNPQTLLRRRLSQSRSRHRPPYPGFQIAPAG